MTLSLVCGAECQIHSVGSGAVADRHWSVADDDGGTGTVGVTASPVRSGSYALHYSSGTSGNDAYHEHRSGLGTETIGYFRGYFRFPDVGPTSEFPVMKFGVDATGWGDAHVDLVLTTGGVLRLRVGATPTYSSTNDITASTDTWYGVEVELDSGNDQAKWRVWTEGGGWTTSETVAGNTVQVPTWGVRLGVTESCGESGFAVYADDIAIGFDSGLYDDTGTNGRSTKVIRLNPVSDGTHNFDSGDFKYDGSGGSDISPSATDVYSHLDAADMEQTSEGVYYADPTTGQYVEANFETVSGSVGGVSLVISGLNDLSETPYQVNISGWQSWAFVLGGGTQTWATYQGMVSGLPTAIRLGNSANIGPVVYGIALEVEWTLGVTLHAVSPTDDVTTTGWTSTPLWSKVDDDVDSPDATVITGTAS